MKKIVKIRATKNSEWEVKSVTEKSVRAEFYRNVLDDTDIFSHINPTTTRNGCSFGKVDTKTFYSPDGLGAITYDFKG